MLDLTWEIFSRYLRNVRRLDESTIARYESSFISIKGFFHQKSYTEDNVTEFFDQERARHLSNSSLNCHLKVFRHIDKKLGIEVVKNIQYSKKTRVAIRYLTNEEFRLVLKARKPIAYRQDPARWRKKNKRFDVILEFAFYFCARVSYVTNLRWTDLLPDHTIIFRDTKNGDDEEFPCDNLELWDKILSLPRYNEWVFGTKQGRASDNSLNENLRERAFEAKIQGWEQLTFHSLRHSGATELANRGAQQTFLQAYLTHKDPASTARYIHVNKKNLISVQRLHPLSKLTKQQLIDDIRGFADKYRGSEFAAITQAMEQFILGRFFAD